MKGKENEGVKRNNSEDEEVEDEDEYENVKMYSVYYGVTNG